MYETGHGATDTLLVSNCHQTISPMLCTVVCVCVCHHQSITWVFILKKESCLGEADGRVMGRIVRVWNTMDCELVGCNQCF